MCEGKEGILSLIGKTPTIRLRNIEKYFGLGAEIYAKLEMHNPTGSVKDRAAYFMIEDAYRRGLIGEKCTIIEPTSGNLGISLAMLSTLYGYKLKIVMPEGVSSERISLINAYGGQVVLSPRVESMAGAIRMAEEIHNEIKTSIMLSQFTNKMNVRSHYLTTGPEIYSEMNGQIDYFIAGVGSGGTIGGVGQYLKKMLCNVKILAVEPSESAVLSGNCSGVHRIQGIGAGFIPPLIDKAMIDIVMTASSDEAEEFMRVLVRREGILAGISSGAVLSQAVRIARVEENCRKKIVILLADGGEKYLSVVR